MIRAAFIGWTVWAASALAADPTLQLHIESTDARVHAYRFRGSTGEAPGFFRSSALDESLCTVPCDAPLDPRLGQGIYFAGPNLSPSGLLPVFDLRGALNVRVEAGSLVQKRVGFAALGVGGLALTVGLTLLIEGLAWHATASAGGPAFLEVLSRAYIDTGLGLSAASLVLGGTGVVLVWKSRTTYTVLP